MDLGQLQKMCKALPKVTEDVKWEDHLCFCIGEKIFMITSPDSVPVSASIKVSEENFEEFTAREGIRPAPYLARYSWILIEDIGLLSPSEWQLLVDEAYKIVSSKLPAKLKRELGLKY